MIEIRWHGRGGNGAFTAARLLGHAASIHEGKAAQAFPSFGPERRGAPVQGFTRIAEQTITDHSQVYQCDCVIVLDETLCDAADTTAGLKESGVYVINTARSAEELRADPRFSDIKNLFPIDATQIALDLLGAPIVNTVLLGAAVGAADLVKMESVEMAIDDMMGESLRGKNKTAARAAFEKVKEVRRNE
ncbi:2-oxoacid:acceptor oxidoreductase family protein [Bacilliculturomica massiliensis]|uniref:2-oxoacid:acceptor oxidoreductase family protein n=1 Tax=Bacilliculturomica massiliensis TaxID=1917867 RepID=UPI0010325521|nr:2-oxoacid:acceptor oxidoreductase family protein [Bacilliculturomica massiliensis]